MNENTRINSASERISVGRHSGFCFGVKRAADTVERLLRAARPGERIFTLGRLIHNDSYIAALTARGVGVVGEADISVLACEASDSAPVTVIIRAHGIPRGTERVLESAARENVNFRFVDCTCPYVKKIHRTASENSGEGVCFVLMGSADHPEVVGIMSCVKGEGHVFRSAVELERAAADGVLGDLHKKRLCLAAQTTFDLSEWEKSQKKSKKLCTNALIFDTICDVTEKRQAEADKLSRASELMFIIGSSGSSNTMKLFDICRKNCPSSYLMEDAAALRTLEPDIIKAIARKRTGIVAGASTPVGIIQEVYRIMSEITEIKAENFEEMLESSLKTLNTGDTVTGYVTSVTDAELQLDLGAKVTGVITADQATDDPSAKLTEIFKVGDKVDAFVIKVSDIDGFATLSKRRVDSDKNWQKIVAAKDNGDVLEGKVVAVNKGGVEVSVDSNRVFVPASQTGIPKSGDMSSLVGTTVKLRIIEIKEQGKRAVGSIRLVLRDEKREREADFWNNIEVGKQYTGEVMEDVDGLIHISQISTSRIGKPDDVLNIGDVVDVRIIAIDEEKQKISLSIRSLLEEAYESGEQADDYTPGE